MGLSSRVEGRRLATDLGTQIRDLSVEMATDSSGAKSFASRRGSGRIRRIEVKWF